MSPARPTQNNSSGSEFIRIVWYEMNQKIGAYVQGRVIEIIVVSSVSVITFALLGLQYAFLLGVLLGFSVIVPYILDVVKINVILTCQILAHSKALVADSNKSEQFDHPEKYLGKKK